MVLYGGNALADYGTPAIQFACSSEDHRFEMSAVGLANVPELSAGKDESAVAEYIRRMEQDRNLFIQGGEERDFEFPCETGRGHILAKMHFFPATSSSNCGLFPGGRLVVLVDDHTLVDNVYWDLDCAPSIKKLTVSMRRRGPRAEVRVSGDVDDSGRTSSNCSFSMVVPLPVATASVLTQESLRRKLVRLKAKCPRSDWN